ncbi:MAG: HAMP domain-containing histidine kinase, partial [Negativicutes bacterium]|nr:HAMP domain-containing histidine kinase [Negativicutes bacterium]
YRGRPVFDPRIFLILRGEDGRVVNLTPFRADESTNLAAIAAGVKTREPQTIEHEEHVYRVVSVPYRYSEKSLTTQEKFVIKDVIAVSIVDSEVGLLNNLLLIIVGGLVAGMLVIVLAGYLLARRAMVPIEEAWNKQQQFVADASHELRSPITGIHSNAELMLRHPDHTIKEESFRLHNIMTETARMTKLIASLLTLARSDANKAELLLTPVDIGELLQVVVEHFRALEELNNTKLTVNIQPDLTTMADQERIHQLFVILLDNAFKYTPPGGEIKLSAAKLDKNIVVTVADTGCGIAAEHLPRVFDRFFRADKARSRDKGGTGLGLAIAKWIVDKHRGKIEVASEIGKGSIFTVVIPLLKIRKEG